MNIVYLPPANEVCEGYVFTGVCLSTVGVCLWPGGVCYTSQANTPSADPLGRHPWADTPLLDRHPPPGQTPLDRHPQGDTPLCRQPPLGKTSPPGQTPSPLQTPLWADTPAPCADTPPLRDTTDTVNKRAVRILLECILLGLIDGQIDFRHDYHQRVAGVVDSYLRKQS